MGRKYSFSAKSAEISVVVVVVVVVVPLHPLGGPFYLVQKSKFFAAKAIETL